MQNGKYLILGCIIFTATACETTSKSELAEPGAGVATMTAKINFEPWTADGLRINNDTQFKLFGTMKSGTDKYVSIIIKLPKPASEGRYTAAEGLVCSFTEEVLGQYSGPVVWSSEFVGDAELIITKFDAATLTASGSFQFTAKDVYGNMKQISEGSFSQIAVMPSYTLSAN